MSKIRLSIGWINKDGYSENQIKTFIDTDAAYDFCKKHIDLIARIGGTRFKHLDDPNQEDIMPTNEALRTIVLDNCKI